MVFRTLVNATIKRIPLIRFRKGGLVLAGGKIEGLQDVKATDSVAKASISVERGPVIEDWELPPRYWRKPMEDVEMDYINRGGPA